MNTNKSVKSKPTINKGGRPKKNELKKRTIRHDIYFSQEEHVKLNSMVNSSNYLSTNEFIRAMLFEQSIKLYYEDKNREIIIQQLSKIGGNVNQIAKRMNQMKNTYNTVSEKDISTIKDLLKILSEIKI